MIDIPDEENAMGYYKIRQQLQKLSEELLQFIHQPKYLLPYLQPGRLVHVSLFRGKLCHRYSALFFLAQLFNYFSKFDRVFSIKKKLYNAQYFFPFLFFTSLLESNRYSMKFFDLF